MALDRAGEALADGRALHVDLLAHGEGRHRNHGARLEAGGHIGRDAEFLEHFACFHTRLGEVAGLRLVDAGRIPLGLPGNQISRQPS